MQKLTSRDINSLVAFLSENISVYTGDKRVLIKPGLKLKHVGNEKFQGTGLNYTVDSVDSFKDGIIIKCTRKDVDGSTVSISITGKDLKQFERA